MSEFSITLSDREVAVQIANMINEHNLWAMHFTANSILASRVRYFIELCGDRVVGCAGSEREYATLSKIMHICVLPEHRGAGIAHKLTKKVIEDCETEFVYMTIREDNLPSLTLAHSFGFRFVEKRWFRDHWTYVLSRRKDGKILINGKGAVKWQ